MFINRLITDAILRLHTFKNIIIETLQNKPNHFQVNEEMNPSNVSDGP